MDLTPIYDLRNRLRALAIAGTELIEEDYRLKRAIEAMAPLEGVSPVFAKISGMAKQLISSDRAGRPGLLLEAIALTDAVLCTQSAVNVPGEMNELEAPSSPMPMVNVPYSVLHTLLDALEHSGNGRYGYVTQLHGQQPELFEDYRVKAAMVKALGASYPELAEDVSQWLKQSGEAVLPLLMDGFDPKGRKEMVRRVQVMEYIAKDKANPFYLQQLPESEKAVREALIFALRHSRENVDTLIGMTRTERGNCKKKALWALAHIDCPESEAFWTEFLNKKPGEMLYLYASEADWAGDILVKEIHARLENWKHENLSETETYLEALAGKQGHAVCQCFLAAAAVKALQPRCGEILHKAILRRPDADWENVAVELYENYGSAFFAAALTTKLLLEPAEACRQWVEGQIWKKGIFSKEMDKTLRPYLIKAMAHVGWDKARQSYHLQIITKNLADEQFWSFRKDIDQPMDGYFTDLGMQTASLEMDKIMAKWIQEKDSDYCRKLRDYYYQKALQNKDNAGYLPLLRQCGAKDCSMLAVKYFEGTKTYLWEINEYFRQLPGSPEAKKEEAERVGELLRKGKMKCAYLKSDEIDLRIEEWAMS